MSSGCLLPGIAVFAHDLAVLRVCWLGVAGWLGGSVAGIDEVRCWQVARAGAGSPALGGAGRAGLPECRAAGERADRLLAPGPAGPGLGSQAQKHHWKPVKTSQTHQQKLPSLNLGFMPGGVSLRSVTLAASATTVPADSA